MPTEKVLNLPLSGNELIEIILQRIETRLRRDCFLHEAATYNGFSYDLTLNIKFKDMMMGKETLVWDKHDEPKVHVSEIATWTEDMTVLTDQLAKTTEKFDSLSFSKVPNQESPNAVRQAHDMDIPVQVQEGRRTVIRKRQFAKEEQ